MKPKFPIILLSLLACVSSHAAVSLVNGDFETQTPPNNADIQSINSWFESATPANGSGYQDWLFISASAATLAGNTSTVLGFSTATGYVYQQIGTYTSGETINLTGIAMKRNEWGSSFNGFTVGLLAGDFAAADGTALVATTLATQSFTAAGLGLPVGNNYTAGNVPFSASLAAGTGLATEGSQLWILISRPVAGGELFLDNLAVTSVPEPSAAVLGALVGLLSFVRRR